LGGAIFDQSSAPDGTAVGESILASSAGSGNCAPGGRIIDSNYNISDDHTCGFAGTGAEGQAIGDGVDPELDPAGLKDNGGPTATIAEQSDSPSVDAVSHQNCASVVGGMGTDQRGEPRPDPKDALSGVCDIGAYEMQQAPASTATPTITKTPIATQTATRTPVRTSTSTPTGSPTVTPKSCVGDCNGTGTVTIDELIKMVNIALGGVPPSSCPNGIPDEPVTIDELIKGVNNALGGCQK
jgi:hypothetical protein